MGFLNLGLIWKGMAMGIAEVIPGVSGGTIAFITGIYQRLINCIKSFDVEFLSLIKSGEFRAAGKKVDINFILSLGLGMVAGIIVGVFAIHYLLENYPEPLWGFFFGLIVASAIYIGLQSDISKPINIVMLILGFVIAFGITLVSPTEGNPALWFVTLSGAIAISAMLLPGISGSFILLLMGMYTLIIPSIKHFLQHRDLASLLILVFFGIGMLIGLVTFSRVLSWLFNHYKSLVLALLTGFLLGSLNKIWPWRNISSIMDKDSGLITKINDSVQIQNMDKSMMKILSETNVLPANYWGDPKVIITILACIIGFSIVFLMEKNNRSETRN